jgi:hypothetical protein
MMQLGLTTTNLEGLFRILQSVDYTGYAGTATGSPTQRVSISPTFQTSPQSWHIIGIQAEIDFSEGSRTVIVQGSPNTSTWNDYYVNRATSYVDGVTVATVDNPASAPWLVGPLDTVVRPRMRVNKELLLGHAFKTGQPGGQPTGRGWHGQLGEVLLTSGRLSIGDIEAVFKYLNNKWNVY